MVRKISPERRAYLQTPEGQKFRTDVQRWRQKIATQRSLGSSAPAVELPTRDMLRRPGALERVLDSIKVRFQLADQRHRQHIDHEVVLCMQTARLLNSSLFVTREILGGKWAEYWRKSDKKPCVALRFVFAKTHNDSKKASFYYNATRVLFEEGIKLELVMN